MSDSPTIAFAGGVPASIGGGGLELQMARTADALRARGLEVFDVAAATQRSFDILHVFSSGPDVAHWVSHWRRSPEAKLVVTPVIVVSPVVNELRQRVAHKLPIPEFGPRMRRGLLQRADAIVVCTEYEGTLVRRLAGSSTVDPVLVPNGADAVAHKSPPAQLPDRYVVLSGTVSRRKRQLEAVRAIGAASGPPPVVLGGFDGSPQERREFELALASANGIWFGEVGDQGQVRAIVAGAQALVHLSAAEGQAQAIVEALAENTPVIGADIPSNAELARRYPEHMHLVGAPRDVPQALRRTTLRPDRTPGIPTWADVAAMISAVYEDLGAR